MHQHGPPGHRLAQVCITLTPLTASSRVKSRDGVTAIDQHSIQISHPFADVWVTQHTINSGKPATFYT